MKNICVFILIAILCVGNLQAKDKVNIVIILIDDMGYGDLNSYGAILYDTPNLDKLAMDGMRFTNFYVPQPVCSASRAGLLTGCYPNRIGITGALFPYFKYGLNPNELTIAEMLKEQGYETGIFGKWHLGNHEKFYPLQHGFDEFFGLPYSNDMWDLNLDGSPIDPNTPKGKNPHPPLYIMEGNKKTIPINSMEVQDQLTTMITERAVKFIERNKNNPFFLYVPHPMVHIPLGVSSKFKGKSEQGIYGDVMMELDWSVGEIEKALKNNGLDENTLLIFTSDNGPWMNYGAHAGSNGALRGGKGNCWEGGVKVPCIMKYPKMIPKGAVCSKLSSTIDLLPTIAEMTNGKLPKHKIDGVNILPLLKGEKDIEPRKHFYYYFRKNNLEAVRNNKWKLVLPHPYQSYENVLPRDDRFPGKYSHSTSELELYDLRRDPGERYNVIEKYPEVVKELEKIVEEARKDLGDNLTKREPSKNVRKKGTID